MDKTTELENMVYSLRRFIEIYQMLNNKTFYSNAEVKKSVQTSIKEICTQIINNTTN